ncbi:MAG: helix-turn-helix transcriptional regulator [Chloroflexota bacterium]
MQAAQDAGAGAVGPGRPRDRWTLLSNHGHVLVCVSRDPGMRVRDLAAVTGLTERAIGGILRDLEAAGYITRERVGRRTHYLLHPDRAFRHPAEADHHVGELLRIFSADA